MVHGGSLGMSGHSCRSPFFFSCRDLHLLAIMLTVQSDRSHRSWWVHSATKWRRGVAHVWLCYYVHLYITQVTEETLSTVVRCKSINKEVVVSVKMSCDSAHISLILLSYSWMSHQPCPHPKWLCNYANNANLLIAFYGLNMTRYQQKTDLPSSAPSSSYPYGCLLRI